MKINFTLLALCFSVVLMAQQHPGTLDYSFGDSGKVISKNFGDCYDMAVQADNKIVCLGDSGVIGLRNLRIVRYLPDGTLDSAFGKQGILDPVVIETIVTPTSIAIQPDQKILAAGSGYKNGIPTNVLLRILPDGTMDNSFGVNGIVDSTFGIGESFPYITLQPDGKIVEVSWYYPGFLLVRYNPDGSLDKSFGNNGTVLTGFGGVTIPTSIALEPDGKIVIGGNYNATYTEFLLARYTTNGTLDGSFGHQGIITTNFGKYGDAIDDIVIQPDGKIIVGGQTGLQFDFQNENVAIARYQINGDLDDSFANAGKATVIFPNFDASADRVILQPDNKIVFAGEIYSLFSPVQDFALGRLLNNGNLDSSFGVDGETTTDFGLVEQTGGLALQNGKILLAGTSLTYSPQDETDYALARYYSDSLTKKQIIAQKIRHYIQTHNVQATTLGNVSIYPNPAQNMLHVVGLSSAQTKLTVVDLNGSIRMQAVANAASFNLNIASLYAGNYMLKIETNGEVVTKQFVK
jgi:uncharacterized delta-60 repeat protein